MIDIEELEQITQQVWELIMESEIAPCSAESLSSQAAPQVAYVDLEGAFEGTVALQLDDRITRAAAAMMFGTDIDAVTDTEQLDTSRELANMVGGNVKCLVEQPTKLGLPVVVPADDFHGQRGRAACKLAFTHEGIPFHVMVYMGPNPAPASDA